MQTPTNLFFALTDDTTFNPKSHARCDFDVLELEIEEKESEVACAKIVVPHAPLIDLLENKHKNLMIGFGLQNDDFACLFRGFFDGCIAQTHKVQTLLFSAKGKDHAAQLQALLKDHKQSAFYSPLLVAENEEDNPNIILKARPLHFATCRVTHKVATHPLFGGAKPHAVGGRYFPQTFKIYQTQRPPKKINVALEAGWIRNHHGFMHLHHRMHSDNKNHGGGLIETVTPNALKKAWPKKGQTLGPTPYFVVASSLTPWAKTPENVHPINHTCWMQKEPQNAPQSIQKMLLTEATFRPLLVVGWQHQQRCLETANIDVHHLFNPNPVLDRSHTAHPHETYTEDIEKEEMFFSVTRMLSAHQKHPFWTPHTPYVKGDRVQNAESGALKLYVCEKNHTSAFRFVCDKKFWTHKNTKRKDLPPSATSFFASDIGKHTLSCAMDCVTTHLAKRARFLWTTLDLDPSAFWFLTTRDTVDIDLPIQNAAGEKRNKVKAKVVHYKMVFQNTKAILKITCAVCTGCKDAATKTKRQKPKNTYAAGYAKFYTETNDPFFNTHSGVLVDMSPLSAKDPAPFDETQLLESSFVRNTKKVQCRTLQKHKTQNKPYAAKNLAALNTQVHFAFKPLAHSSSWQKNINLKPVYWTTPKI